MLVNNDNQLTKDEDDLENRLDDTLIAAVESPQYKGFCLNMEEFLVNFVKTDKLIIFINNALLLLY